MTTNQDQRCIEATRLWVERVVIDLNLCPFAKREWVKDKVRLNISQAETADGLLHDLVVELALLSRKPEIETTLLIHPYTLNSFEEFNEFLSFTDLVIEQMSLQGVYQIASFHPHYQFKGTQKGDVENYTNRSPYPMLHILRETSLEEAIQKHPDTNAIPINNMNLLRKLGHKRMTELLESCSHHQ